MVRFLFSAMGATESKHGVYVVLPNGRMLDVEEEITVGEIIIDFPHCFVTSAEQILKGATGKRLKLPADTVLSYGKTYYVRPCADKHKSRTEWAKDAEVAAVLDEILGLRNHRTESRPRQHSSRIDGPTTPTVRPSNHATKHRRSTSWGAGATTIIASSISSWEAAVASGMLPHSAPDLMVHPDPPAASDGNQWKHCDTPRDGRAGAEEPLKSDVNDGERRFRWRGGKGGAAQGKGGKKGRSIKRSLSVDADEECDEVFQLFLKQMQAVQDGNVKNTRKWKPSLEDIAEAEARMLPHITVVTRYRGRSIRAY